MRKRKMGLVIFILFMKFWSSWAYEVSLTPIDKLILYDNFMNNELNPFIFSQKMIELDNKSTLKLLDEYTFFNGFWGDVLKVEVSDGRYKGLTGYVLEDEVVISPQSLKQGVKVFFKMDQLITDNYLMKENMTCTVDDVKLDYDGLAILTLRTLFTEKHNIVFEYKNKNNLHFVIDKKTEIAYHLRRGDNVVKAVNADTLLPVVQAVCQNAVSDDEGILYLSKKDVNKVIRIKKPGFTDGIVFPLGDEKVNLVFMVPCNKLPIPLEPGMMYHDALYEFYQSGKDRLIFNQGMENLIKVPNSSDIINTPQMERNQKNNQLQMKIFSLNELNCLALPEFKEENNRIIGAFYLERPDDIYPIKCRVKTNQQPVSVYYFNSITGKWYNENLIVTDNYIEISQLKSGYYCIRQLFNEDKMSSLKLENKRQLIISPIFFKNRTGGLIYQYHPDKMNTPDIQNIKTDVYEILFFIQDKPFQLQHKIIYPGSGENIYDLEEFLSDEKQTRFDPSNITINLNQKPQGFNDLFNGSWYRRAIKEQGIFVKEKKQIEHLGNMILEGYQVVFKTDEYELCGFIDVVDDKRLNIIIKRISHPVMTFDGNRCFNITPSLFDSEIVIPVLYEFLAGVLQFYFDGIYFIRNKVGTYIPDEKARIQVGSLLPGKPKYPAGERDAYYKIYFSQN